MKKFITSILILCALATGSIAQESSTNDAPVISGPGWDAIQFLGTGSNWIFAPYLIYSGDSKTYGAGIGAGYKINDFVIPTLRLDGLMTEGNFEVWMPSASLHLQAPLKLMNKVTVVPFAFAGIATPIAGRGDDNGTPVGIFGVGGAVRLDFLGERKWFKPTHLLFDCEKWSSFKGNQWRLGFGFSL